MGHELTPRKRYRMKQTGILCTKEVIDDINILYEMYAMRFNRVELIQKALKTMRGLVVSRACLYRILSEYGEHPMFDKQYKDENPRSYKWDFSNENILQPAF